ncbi:hypothetical protein ABT010_22665 [Streptomyces sp. NPDC002668]
MSSYGRLELDRASHLDLSLPVVPGARAAADAGLRQPLGEVRLFSR